MRPLRPSELPADMTGRQIRRALDWRHAERKGLLPQERLVPVRTPPRSPAELLDDLDVRCVELQQRIFDLLKVVRR